MINDKNLYQGMFVFNEGFDKNILESEYLQKEFDIIESFIKLIKAQECIPSFKSKFSLTSREIEILSTISRGVTFKSAANEFNISESTIRFHIENIKQKIGISNKPELINFFHKYPHQKF
jgi:DNA-binding CsgD family transcriptional regulator